ncbi:hypothetical protein BJV78DRAFT_1294242 [Lactifluus subvellereus]|nr:hypothetical protein BJV78DRAFT_1294242 [Lactifluus subvellereus]
MPGCMDPSNGMVTNLTSGLVIRVIDGNGELQITIAKYRDGNRTVLGRKRHNALQHVVTRMNMRYVVRDDMLLQIPAAAKRQGDIPAYTIRDCAVQIQNPSAASDSRMKAQHHTHTTADVDKIIRKHYNSNLQDIPLWLARHDAFHNAGLYMSSACASDDALVRIITPSAFAGGLICVHPSSECHSDFQKKHSTTAMPYGLNGGVDLGEMVIATVSTIRQALENTGWLFFPAFMDEHGPQDPGHLLYMRSKELSHLVNQHVRWTSLPKPISVQAITGINEVDIKIGEECGELYLLEATGSGPLSATFYLYNSISGDLFTITEPNTTYEAILEQIHTNFDGLKIAEFEEAEGTSPDDRKGVKYLYLWLCEGDLEGAADVQMSIIDWFWVRGTSSGDERGAPEQGAGEGSLGGVGFQTPLDLHVVQILSTPHAQTD